VLQQKQAYIKILDTVSRAAEKKRQKDLFASIADV
jgi:hypothetical protein